MVSLQQVSRFAIKDLRFDLHHPGCDRGQPICFGKPRECAEHGMHTESIIRTPVNVLEHPVSPQTHLSGFTTLSLMVVDLQDKGSMRQDLGMRSK
jgi:hypothetical protein